ncbi:ankyrin repeat-containing protein [Cardiosporidium cionae]|uniref:Ankyrin repeat-containing protein n=1 Tax=Cardiosporidium cionae TaxID=476202 RepID=A0ABQ7JE27_9APIC|nr:ankyrin repeat-containing protein [Cardiosporidium cionae]|eukprot:KAF8822253.1 ankyrin repeat-containing protein [Cardiosporidium cionae]
MYRIEEVGVNTASSSTGNMQAKLQNALLDLCRQDKGEEAIKLIHESKDLTNVDFEDDTKWSPLIWACCHGNFKLAHFLIQKGAAQRYSLCAPKLRGNAQQPPATQHRHSVVYLPRGSLTSSLLGDVSTEDAGTLLRPHNLSMTKMGNPEEAAKLFAHLRGFAHGHALKPVAEKLPPLFSRSPLHWAAFNGHQKIVGLLLRHGLSPHVKDTLGNTALHQAVSGDSLEVTKCLMSHGFDIHQKNRRNHTIKDLATSQEMNKLINKALMTVKCSITNKEFSSSAHRFIAPVIQKKINQLQYRMQQLLQTGTAEDLSKFLPEAKGQLVDVHLFNKCEKKLQLLQALAELTRVTTMADISEINTDTNVLQALETVIFQAQRYGASESEMKVSIKLKNLLTSRQNIKLLLEQTYKPGFEATEADLKLFHATANSIDVQMIPPQEKKFLWQAQKRIDMTRKLQRAIVDLKILDELQLKSGDEDPQLQLLLLPENILVESQRKKIVILLRRGEELGIPSGVLQHARQRFKQLKRTLELRDSIANQNNNKSKKKKMPARGSSKKNSSSAMSHQATRSNPPQKYSNNKQKQNLPIAHKSKKP